MVRSASDYKLFVREHGYRMWVHKVLRDRGYDLDIPWGAPRGKVQAYIHNDAWVAYCPDITCTGIIIVDEEDPVMFCVDCHNALNNKHPYSIEFKNKNEVEHLMSLRKNPRTRNWLPGETIEDLMLEQERHGEL